MKRILLSCVLVLQLIPISAQEPAKLDPDSLLLDLEIITTSIGENHPLMYSYISGKSFDSLTSGFKGQIENGVTLPQFRAALTGLISKIGCGHTYVYPINQQQSSEEESDNDLPFEIEVIDTCVYISKGLLLEYNRYVGEKIFAVNGVSASALLLSSLPDISSDGYNQTFRLHRFRTRFMDFIQRTLDYPDSLTFTMSSGSFKIFCPTQFKKSESEEEEPFFEEMNDLTGTVLLTIPGFDEGRGKIKKCFKYIQKHSIKNLIIDLRNNPGGNGNIGSFLTSFILDTTTTYYLDQKTNPIKYKEYFGGRQGLMISNQYILSNEGVKSYYFNIHPQKENNFNGKLFVLVDGGTLSTGAFVASLLRHKTASTFIGEETGGSEFGIGGGVIGKLTLPYSQLSIKFPLFRWRFNATEFDRGTGVIPHYIVTYRPSDLKSGKDLELEKAKELILTHQ